MASSLPSIDGIATGAKFNLCVGLQAGDIASSFLGALGLDASSAADAYPALFEWACDLPPSSAPTPPAPPFQGGQCPTIYDGQLSLNVVEVATGNPVTTNPISFSGLGPLSVEVTDQGTLIRVRVAFADGLFSQSTLAIKSAVTYQSYNLTSSRADGGPDNCGNPPLPPAPPYPPTGLPVTGPITYVDEDGDTINVDGDFVFNAPIVNLNGQVNVDFSVDLGDRSYNGTLNLSTGDFNVTPNFVLPGRPNLTIDGTQEEPLPPSSDEPEDDDKNTDMIVAIVVTSDITNNRFSSEKFYAGQPTTTVPRLGVARFAVPIPGSSSAAWTTDIPIKQSRQWIDCPCPYGAVDAIASPEPGSGVVILGIQYIRGKPPAALE